MHHILTSYPEECGSIFDIFYDPRHPYTWGLLSAVPESGDADEELYSIPGTPPNLAQDIVGDAFAPRNPYAMEVDFKAEPPMFKVGNTHYAATWLADERAPAVEMPKRLKERIERMKRREDIMSKTDEDSFLRVEDMCMYFDVGGRRVKAAEHISFDMKKGEIFGLVGESGSGKC